jgi:type I restriction enzyme M protein
MSWLNHAANVINDRARKVVQLDLAGRKVRYIDSRLKLHRDLQDLTGGEEVVRASLIDRLVNELGYKPELIELEREYQAGRPKKIAPRIDVIVNDSSGKPFFFIEVKEPSKFESDKEFIEGQLFQLSGLHEAETGNRPEYLVYYTIEESNGVLIDKAIIIDRGLYSTYRQWVDAGEPSIGNTLTPKYNKPKKEALTKGGTRDLAQTFTLEEIIALATNLHNVLWGGGGTGDTEIFSALVNLILAKIQDEYDTEEGGEYQFQVFQHGDELEKTDELFDRINSVYRKALRDQLNKHGNLEDQWVVNKEKMSLSKVLFTVQQLEKYSFIDGKSSLTGKDILGDFFEKIQREGFKQTKGQFFTPVNVTKFMLYGLELDELSLTMLNERRDLPLIIDPSCGSATFLIEAMKLITNEIKRRRKTEISSSRAVAQRFDELFMPDNHEHKWARHHLYGIEHNFELATASKVNMILHGDGTTNIFQQDGLKPFRFYSKSEGANSLVLSAKSAAYRELEVNEQFDVVVSNPPFSVSLDDETKRYLRSAFLFGRKRNSENLFIERYWQLLKEGGRLAIILPESVFDTTENRYIRLFIFAFFDPVAVVSLPKVSFEPYTQTKTSVLFARKKPSKAIDDWFAEWTSLSSEYAKLRTRVNHYVDVFISGQPKSRFRSIKDDTDETIRRNIERFLGIILTGEENHASIKELVASYQPMIEEISSTDGDRDDIFGDVNAQWVFQRMKSTAQRSIFIAEASHVGYKRTKKGSRPQPNDLYSLELAPASLPVSDVNTALEVITLVADAEVQSLANRIAAIDALTETTATDTKERVRLSSRLAHKEDHAKRQREFRAEVLAMISQCYSPLGELLPVFSDRRDARLRRLFSDDRLAAWRSNEIIVKASEPDSILERMRAANLWSA